MKKKILGLLLFCGALAFTACDNNDEIKYTKVSNIELNLASENGTYTIESGTFTFTNVTTQAVTTKDYPLKNEDINLPEGLYNISFKGTANYESSDKKAEVTVQGVKENVQLTGTSFDLSIDLTAPVIEGNFVISEIFIGGTVLPTTGKQYQGGDQYFKIFNNSDQTLYADGLAIIESEFQTTMKQEYNPDIMNEAMTIQCLFVIPGDGKTYPVAPGEELIICDTAIDHTAVNSNSIDLTKADFEWYTESNSQTIKDQDNPEVPNLTQLYCYTNTIWTLNKQGNRAYALARIPESVTAENYINNYSYTGNYIIATTGKPSKSFTYYKVPNEWIIDAVNVSPTNKRVWNVTASSLDMGYTYIGANVTLAENYNKAVRRKEAPSVNGVKKLQKTNNSTDDFEPAVTASLIENK